MITIKLPLYFDNANECADTFDVLDRIFDQAISYTEDNKGIFSIDTPLQSKLLRVGSLICDPLSYNYDFEVLKKHTDQQICLREYQKGKWQIITLLEMKQLEKFKDNGQKTNN